MVVLEDPIYLLPGKMNGIAKASRRACLISQLGELQMAYMVTRVAVTQELTARTDLFDHIQSHGSAACIQYAGSDAYPMIDVSCKD